MNPNTYDIKEFESAEDARRQGYTRALGAMAGMVAAMGLQDRAQWEREQRDDERQTRARSYGGGKRSRYKTRPKKHR